MWVLTAGMRHGNQFENEDLIRWGWPEDVWFHVDKLSSAHVYLRLPKGVMWDAIPEEGQQQVLNVVLATIQAEPQASLINFLVRPTR